MRRASHEVFAPHVRCSAAKVPLRVECHTLRTAEAAIERLDIAVIRDAIDTVEAGCGGTADVQMSIGSPREVVGGNRGLDGGVNENLPVWRDLENGAAAVADVKVV